MIYIVFSLYYLHLFSPLATVSLLGLLWKSLFFSLRIHVCVVVFIHKKENWQCFSRLLSRHYPTCFDHVLSCIPSGVQLLNGRFYTKDALSVWTDNASSSIKTANCITIVIHLILVKVM